MQGFVGEMRKVAMKLHTREQAPKEGGIEAPKEQRAFAPTLEGYARFLSESKVVYDTFEGILASAPRPEYAQFQNTGLERGAVLATDLEWLSQQYGVQVPPPAPDSPGSSYSALVQKLAVEDPPAFICHYYNFYFAHTAGGRMIGSKVAGMLLGGKTLGFYQWEGDVAQLLDAVRAKINTLAEGWGKEEKERCLEETAASFKYSGSLMRAMM